jgi:hypothetical protein
MTCRVCGNKKRLEIDRALLEGQSLRDIAKRTGTTASSLQRHKADHLARDLVKAHEAREVARADSLLDDVRKAEGRAERLIEAAENILEEAREAEDRKTAVGAIRAAAHAMAERRNLMALRGTLTGELSNVADAAANVPMIVRVLSVPRMPGVQTVHGWNPPALEAPAEPTEAARSLPVAESRVVDAPVESEPSVVPGRNRR